MAHVLIFGATDLAKLAHHYLTQELGVPVTAFVVDAEYKTQNEFLGLPVIDWERAKTDFPPAHTQMFVAVGYKRMRLREKAYAQAKAAGYALINIISPAAHIAKGVTLADNNFIMPGAVIEPFVTVGHNNVIWSNVTVCHEGAIGNHNFIAADTTLGGHVKLGNQNFIGFAATVLQNVTIGDETVIGAKALVRENTKNQQRYWGNPATAQGAVDANTGIEVAT